MSDETLNFSTAPHPVVPEHADIHAYQAMIVCHECVFEDGRPLLVKLDHHDQAVHLAQHHVHLDGSMGPPTHATQQWHASAPLDF